MDVTEAERPKGKPSKGRVVLRAALAVAGLIVLLLVAALVFPQQVLCIDSGNVRGDAMVLLGGGSYERPLRAAELYKAGAAPKVIISGHGDAPRNRQSLLGKGVPATALVVEDKSTTTRENALLSIPLLRAQGARRVVLVTSWYHSRRALKTFQHYAPDIQFYSKPSYYAFPRAQWRPQGVKGQVRLEYMKLAGYCVRYGVWPW
jgi:uncharacterized SAM-binding protein YcdF (DUF218 family)